MLGIIGTGICVFIIFGLSCAGGVHWVRGAPPSLSDRILSLVLGLGLGPVMTSALFSIVLFFYPGRSSGFYLGIVLTAFVIAATLFHKSVKALFQGDSPPTRKWGRRSLAALSILLVCSVAAGHLWGQALRLPTVGHDSVEYLFVGAHILQEKSLSNYPMSKPDAVTGGMFPMVCHLPGLPALYAWLGLAAGDPLSVLSRMVSPFYGTLLAVLTALLAWRRLNVYAGLAAAALVLATPCFGIQFKGNSIDGMRIFMDLAAAALCAELIRRETAKAFLAVAVFLAATIFIHNSGLLMPPAMGLAYLLFSRRIRWRKTALAAAVAAAGVAGVLLFNMGGSRYSPKPFEDISDTVLMETLGADWLEKVRSGVAHPVDRIWVERLQFLSRPSIFGATYALGLVGLIFWTFRMRKSPQDKVLLVFAIALAVPCVWKYYHNYRYMSTTVPVAAYFAGLAVGSLAAGMERRWPRLLHVSLATLSFKILGVLVVLWIGGARLLGYVEETVPKAAPAIEAARKYLNWKTQANPADFAAIQAVKAVPAGMRILLVAHRKEPIHYLLGGDAKFEQVNSERMAAEFLTGADFAAKLAAMNIAAVVIHPGELKKTDTASVKMLRNLGWEKIFESRGYTVHMRRPAPP